MTMQMMIAYAGRSRAKASAWAAATPTTSEPARPGPHVTATRLCRRKYDARAQARPRSPRSPSRRAFGWRFPARRRRIRGGIHLGWRERLTPRCDRPRLPKRPCRRTRFDAEQTHGLPIRETDFVPLTARSSAFARVGLLSIVLLVATLRMSLKISNSASPHDLEYPSGWP